MGIEIYETRHLARPPSTYRVASELIPEFDGADNTI
jgi:hypothetical protein